MLTNEELFELATLANKARPDKFIIDDEVYRLPNKNFIYFNGKYWNPELSDRDFVQLLCFAEDVNDHIGNGRFLENAANQIFNFWSSLSQDNRKEIYCQKVLEMLRAKDVMICSTE